MFFIDSVEINGMWGYKNISVKFNPDINIFIGKNGTGKTTFLSIISSVLEVNISKLRTLNFDNVQIILADKEHHTKTIKVRKESDCILYKISNQNFSIEFERRKNILSYDMPERHYMRANIKRICDELDKIRILSTLSVSREEELLEYNERHREIENPIEKKLRATELKLCNVYRKWDRDVQQIYEEFQRQMLLLMLYDPKYDSIKNIDALSNFDTERLKNGLIEAYKRVNLSSADIDSKIAKHVARINDSISAKKKLAPGVAWSADDALPLPLWARSIKIVQLLNESEQKKDDVFYIYNIFKKEFYDFCKKEIVVKPYDNEILLNIDHLLDYNVCLSQLSSGEKQLFILLVEAVMMNRRTVISITDEPELSLHIAWQRNLLSSIRKLNSNAQIIVATHSPEIAGGFPCSVIDMESIVK